MHTDTQANTFFSINLTAILKWIILNLSNSTLHMLVTLNWDIVGWTTIRAELFSQLQQRT